VSIEARYIPGTPQHAARLANQRARRDRIKGTPEYFRRLEIQRQHNENYRENRAVKAMMAARDAKPIPAVKVVHPTIPAPLKGTIALSMLRWKVA